MLSNGQVDNGSGTTPRLALTISNGFIKPCSGKIIVRARLQNLSDGDVLVDKRDLWRVVTFEGPPEQRGEGRREGWSDRVSLNRFRVSFGDNFGDDTVPMDNLVRLHATEVYEESKEFSMRNDFFQVFGDYKLVTQYRQDGYWPALGDSLFTGDVRSNDLSFNLQPCVDKSRKQ